ncbi:hypothetical protein FJN17_07970 [Bradyrhizobium symbiodeficiens]|uniref:Baseplate assembly protein n=1 Tax=Bradyrhizobium symbiodeficiens TaxID=1404367 RepID=A0ABX5W4H4_9BRAD|nr:hypothetical protein [Bradyrhizobium symbiodeficiens]QDF37507.1 hypothetical protein FJN17_07970 [Bradyrhizobium symbiodeficiens]
MSAPQPPDFYPRKRRDLLQELKAQARLWLPEWRQDARKSDPISAVLEIAASINAEVARRLDRVPEKSFRGMLHWLGKRGRTGNAARLPVVFTMVPRSQPTLAIAPVQLQADAAGTPTIFETESSLRLMPAKLAAVFATRTPNDAFYQAAAGLDQLEAPTPMPDRWRLRVATPLGETTVQLDPPEGLSPGMLLKDESGLKYRVVSAKDGLVALSHGIGKTDDATRATTGVYDGWLYRADAFSPFDGKERSLQQHALYIGADAALDIKTLAAIDLVGDELPDAEWSYWGKTNNGAESGWQSLRPIGGSSHTFRKPPGEIEKTDINGVKLRWLRATPRDPAQVLRQPASNIRFRINCVPRDASPKLATAMSDLKKEIGFDPKKIDREAIANTTPVVLDRGFYPFGREPRVFDAFYLSCPEAFAKPNAFAEIDIKVGEAFSGPLNAVGDRQSTLVAGIGLDRKPHLILHTSDRPEGEFQFLPIRQPLDDNGLPVNFVAQRVGAAIFIDSGFAFTATEGTNVWLWAAGGQPTYLTARQSQAIEWRSLGRPPTKNPSDDPIVETVMVHDGVMTCEVLARLRSGAVYTRPPLGGAWALLPIKIDNVEQKIDRLVRFDNTSLPPGRETSGKGLAAVTSAGGLIYRDWNGKWRKVTGFETTPTTAGEHATSAPYPLALWHNEDLHLYAPGRGKSEAGAIVQMLGAVRIDYDAQDPVVLVEMPEPLVGDGFGFVQEGFDDPAVLFALKAGISTRLALWQPFTSKDPYIADETLRLASVEQAPIRLANGALFPLERGDVATGAGPFVRKNKAATALNDIALPQEMPAFDDTRVLLEMGDAGLGYSLADLIKPIGYEFAIKRPKAPKDLVATKIHRVGPARECALTPPYTIELVEDDTEVVVGATLCIIRGRPNDFDRVVTVNDIVVQDGRRIATINENIPSGARGRFYHVVKPSPHTTACKVRPTIVVEPSFKLPGETAQERLAVELHAGEFEFRATLERLPITFGESDRLILEEGWPQQRRLPRKGEAVRLIAKPSVGASVSAPSPRNPEISWEYWNGASWWQIPGVTDTTQHLVRSGLVQFCVPPDLKELEVVGRKGHWIRARLVGGDYGQETVTVEDVSLGEGGKRTGQVVKRDPSTIRAPYIVSIDVSYDLCCAILPTRVITLDNGGYVDQTEINSSPNAVIQAFTPLATAITAAPVADAKSATAGCDDCSKADPEPATKQPGACCDDCAKSDPEAAAPADGGAVAQPAIYLGFSEPLQGASIALLFRVVETERTSALPMEVDAYSGGAFKPIQVVDETHALTETGILTIDCPEPLQKVSYFGQALHWLRLRPPLPLAADWRPEITGIHLNGTWAVAAETWRHEIAGQSDGSPSQGFNLAHDPVLAETLELRVREPLGDDEQAELVREGKYDVVENIGLWQGKWVRWLAGDRATAGPKDRIFDFDASIGAITFGDGVRGMIPPIGADNIVAVRYRSGGKAAANNVAAWAKLNLISPLASVEQVVTPEGAADGSDAQDEASALRFASANIAMRERIVSLADVERFALQHSPDIAQARSLQEPHGVRVIVIMRGRTPRPSNAVRRELARRLREKSTPALRRAGAIIVEGPREVRLGITLEVSVADLARAGPLAAEVEKRLRTLLDPAIGGIEGEGWPLGVTVTDTPVAAVLADIAGIEEIVSVEIVREDGLDAPLAATETPVLPADGLVIRWQQAEVEAP